MGRSATVLAVLLVIAVVTLAGCNAIGGDTSGTIETETTVSTADTSTSTPTDTPTATPRPDSDGDGVPDEVEVENGYNPNKSETNEGIPDEQGIEDGVPPDAQNVFVEIYTSLESDSTREALAEAAYGGDGEVDGEFLDVMRVLSGLPDDIELAAVNQVLEAEDSETAYSNVELLERFSEEYVRAAVENGLREEDWDGDGVVNWEDISEYDSVEEGQSPFEKDSDGDGLSDGEEQIIGSDPASQSPKIVVQLREIGIEEVTEKNADRAEDSDGDGLVDGYEEEVSETPPDDPNADNDLLNDRQEHYNNLTDPNKATMVFALAHDNGVTDGWLYDESNREYFTQVFKEMGFEEVIYLETGEVNMRKDYGNPEDLRDNMPEQIEEAGYPLVIVHDSEAVTYPWIADEERNIVYLDDKALEKNHDKLLSQEITATAASGSEFLGPQIPEEYIDQIRGEYSNGELDKEDDSQESLSGRAVGKIKAGYDSARNKLAG